MSSQRYTDRTALSRMADGKCPECSGTVEDHTGAGRGSLCSLTDNGVAERIYQYEQDIKWGHRVYDVLIEHAGALEANREDFVLAFPRMPEIREYRFCGALGFGGKYWQATKKRPNGWVSCYPEDATKRNGLDEIVVRTNAALDAIGT